MILQTKQSAHGGTSLNLYRQVLSLTRFEPRLRLVYHVYSAFTTHDAAVAVTLLKRAERVFDLHSLLLQSRRVFAPFMVAQYGPPASGGRYWDRTSDPYDVNVVLYR